MPFYVPYPIYTEPPCLKRVLSESLQIASDSCFNTGFLSIM